MCTNPCPDEPFPLSGPFLLRFILYFTATFLPRLVMAKTKKTPVPAQEKPPASDTYKTLAAPAQGLYKEKGSKFLAFAFPVENVEQIKEHLGSLRKEYFDARHHCYAYVLGPKQEIFRENDDGEPSSTAGRPIRGQILSHGLTDVLVAVVRYFGGTKLGVSGLTNAYKLAAADALDSAPRMEKTVMECYQVRFPYSCMNLVMRIVKDFQLKVLSQDVQEDCRLTFSVRLSESDRCREKFAGERIEIQKMES